MTKDLLKGLNDHLKLEFRASHEYLAMSVWLAYDEPTATIATAAMPWWSRSPSPTIWCSKITFWRDSE